MSDRNTFIEQCRRGDAFLDDIDKFVEEWHEAETSDAIWEYLGFSEEEYAAWLEEPYLLRFIVHARLGGTPLGESLKLAGPMSLAARCQNRKEARILQDWLKRTGRL